MKNDTPDEPYRVIREPFDPATELTRKAIGLICSRFNRMHPSDVIEKKCIDTTMVVVGARRKVQAAMFVTTSSANRTCHIEYIASRAPRMGSVLVQQLQTQCLQSLFNITAEVRTDNPRAKDFFTRLGFIFRSKNPRICSCMGFWHGCKFCHVVS